MVYLKIIFATVIMVLQAQGPSANVIRRSGLVITRQTQSLPGGYFPGYPEIRTISSGQHTSAL